MPIIIDGKKTSEEIKKEIAARLLEIKAEGVKIPDLAAVLVGDDGASQTYVGAKVKACELVGFTSTLVRLNDDVSEEELLRKVEEINEDPDIDGLIVQLPLPDHLSVEKVTSKIKPEKDVDDFTLANVWNMALNWHRSVSYSHYGIENRLSCYALHSRDNRFVDLWRMVSVRKAKGILVGSSGNPSN